MYIYNTQLLIFFMLAFYISGILVSIALYKNHRLSNILSNILNCMASVTGIWASVSFLLSGAGKISIFSISSAIPFISFSMAIDRLSSFFILALSLLTLCVSIYSIGYISHYYGKRSVGLFNVMYNIFILSMIAVLTSWNMVFFLISWECMSLVSYFLVVFEGEQHENQKAGVIYLIITHIATAFITIGFVLIYKFTGSLDLGTAMSGASPAVLNIIFLCLLIGFGTKAGIIPLHVWLPYAHPAAPSNISALMSGIMIKTAIYGLIRFVLGTLGAQYQWWGTVILIIGAISTILGIAYALVEHNIKRLLAYSSIENIGIILIGIGISFYAYSSNNLALCALAMAAALLHLFNHTIFKGALFLGAGAIHYSTHTKDMEKLGGLIKKMPFTGLFFLVASLSISAIPPFNGFVGEWLTYQALFTNLGISPGGLKLVMLLTTAALAMAGAFAASCFVKSFGISFLGLPRTEEAKHSKEAPAPMLLGMGILSALCLAIGIFPIPVIKLISSVIGEVPKMTLLDSNFSLLTNLKGTSCFVYCPITINGSTISPLLALAAGILVVAIAMLVTDILGHGTKERKYNTWDCGYTALNSRMQYSATGFSKPLRIVFRAIYRANRELKVEDGPSPYFPKSIKYVVSTQPVFEKYLYLPLVDLFTRFTKKIRLTIQTGSVHTYLSYIFITIVILLVYYGMN